MEIKGMDYNTERVKMRMPEYGRSVHLMVEHCKQIENREERQQCAEAIVETMKRLYPNIRLQQDFQQRLWDHLAIISNFELDIDYPCDVSNAAKVNERPAPLSIPKRNIPVRHYGNLVFSTLDHVTTMPDGEERNELLRLVANQMKRDLMMYGNASPDNERIISDIAHFTDGKVQIDPESFRFDFIQVERKQDKQKARHGRDGKKMKKDEKS